MKPTLGNDTYDRRIQNKAYSTVCDTGNRPNRQNKVKSTHIQYSVGGNNELTGSPQLPQTKVLNFIITVIITTYCY